VNKNLRLLAANAAWSAVTHLLGRGSIVFAAMLLARALGTNSFATYSYFQLTVSMLAAYAAMGMGVTASRFFAEFGYVDEADSAPIGTLWILSTIAGLVFAIIAMVLPKNWLGGGLQVHGGLFAIAIFVTALNVVPSGGILGLERYRDSSVVSGLSATVLIVGAFFAGRTGSVLAAMLVFIFSTFIQSFGNSFVVLRVIGWQTVLKKVSFCAADFQKVAFFAGPMFGVTLLAASGSWIVGRIILAGPSSEHGFALYAIGLQWYALALFIPGMISRVLLPRLVRARYQIESSNRAGLLKSGITLTLFTSVVISSVGIFLSPWLLGLYGSTYQMNKWGIASFLLAAIPAAPANTIGNAIVASDGQRIWFCLSALWLLILALVAKFFVLHGPWRVVR